MFSHDFHVIVNDGTSFWHEAVAQSAKAFSNVPYGPYADEAEDGVYKKQSEEYRYGFESIEHVNRWWILGNLKDLSIPWFSVSEACYCVWT